MLKVVSWSMNLRSRLTGIATGDQAIFVTRAAFAALDGFAAIPLMEDIDFCRRAKALSRPLALRTRVVTSVRALCAWLALLAPPTAHAAAGAQCR